MKVYCIGANKESFIALHYLIYKGCNIDGLITLPQAKYNEVSDYYDLHPFCEENNIKVINIENVNDDNFTQKLKKEKIDYLFTLGWSQIYKKDFINAFSELIIGTHPSKLPYGRGRAPVAWTIIENLKETAVSFFAIDEGVDTGGVILQKEILIKNRIYAEELYNEIALNLGKGFLEIYKKIKKGEKIETYPQKDTKMSYRSKRTITDGLIEFDRPIYQIDNLIRAVSKPYPGAYCYYNDKKVIFWKVDLCENENYLGTLGQIHKKNKEGILVQFLDGNLWLKKATFEKGELVPLDFFKVGTKLGYNIQEQIYYLRQKVKKC